MKGFFLVLALLAVAPLARAEPWLCTDSHGVKEFSYDPQSARRKECVDQPIPSGNVWSGHPRRYDGTPGFPRVDAKTQKERDLARREILERELADERRALAEAMKQLETQKGLHAREKDRARAQAGLKMYEDRVRVHLTNIANIERELGRAG